MTARITMLAALLLGLASFPSESHAQIRALDFDTPAYVDFELTEITVHEDQTSAILNLYRTGDFRRFTRLDYATEELSASEGRDYKGSGGTITFQPGEGMKQIEIPLVQDSDREGSETFRVVLTTSDSYAILMRDSAEITIQDSPGPISTPKLEIASAGQGNISIAWEGSPEYLLERTADPASVNWEVVPSDPVVTGQRCEVIQSAGGVIYIYRLRLP